MPLATVSLVVSRGVPAGTVVMAGSAVLTGGAGGPTTAVGADVASAVPGTLVAITRRRIVPPTSAPVSL